MNKIKCPHCGHEYNTDDMTKSNNDLWAICPEEKDVEEICQKCSQIFWVRGIYNPVYQTFKTEEDLNHA